MPATARPSSSCEPGTEEHGLALLSAAQAAQFEGMFEEARTAAEEAAGELEAVGAFTSAGRAYGVLGNVYFQLGGADRMERALNRAVEILEAQAPGPDLVDIYGRMAALTSLKGLPPQVGLEWTAKGIALGEKLGLRRELIRPRMWQGLGRCELGDLAGIEDLEWARARQWSSASAASLFRRTSTLQTSFGANVGLRQRSSFTRRGSRYARSREEPHRRGSRPSRAGCSTTSASGTSSCVSRKW